ncbi:MAG: hypothetical protein JXB14_03070, partial [Candidatus Altiarchaeota archaeon]|nr:hypothetical protein [Candidatus Altiarchaeota archaeon]
ELHPPTIVFLNLPESISVYTGEKRMVSVILQNSGQVEVYDLSLSVEGIFPPTSIVPSKVPLLDQGSNAMFVFELDVPKSLAPGRYKFRVIAKTSGFEVASGSFYLEVGKMEAQPEFLEFDILTREIENALDILKDLEAEVLKKQSGGVDVSGVLPLLDSARGGLERAAVYLNAFNYNAAREKMEQARQDIKEAVERAAGLSMPAVYTMDLSLVIIALIMLITVLSVLILRRPPRAVRRLLERKELEVIARSIRR